ncbi:MULTISPECIES: type II toxin-antitoxin system VapC family toxin [Streptomyces]|uniref:Death on curing protein, Doc toxin n=1 Tax=Streptomyces venezuelae (strain ATCC 10712 / CBS 650.69 / DSM 40230 / JCM 4526 / NBRC 13096 / PD 04745) TaxID=953739 RepID=F2R6G3_STRVP|nr:type II toxin-antitoxin system VapC family toxin [Streptomyces venezuelae]APE22091.1 twitching motility protein PilT [Streptomyces venezuelae]QER99479.1 type II toxin-antitoxin system VapC family toxin [Streptomyces venezuelae ATCC 10712]QES14752.1 PIN domain nuclease [Streptomyces venezuelae]CCA56214.1 Death on curing protein, Doc toxin [Streptomyces venezuelae ATCC 10712]
MKLLVDTHVVIWWLLDSPQLSDEIKDLLDTEEAAHISAVTPWELSVKQALGKLDGPPELPELARTCQLTPLPITGLHGIRAGALPPHHRDPFDRILVAQAQTEGLTLVTRDKHIPLYDVPVLTV